MDVLIVEPLEPEVHAVAGGAPSRALCARAGARPARLAPGAVTTCARWSLPPSVALDAQVAALRAGAAGRGPRAAPAPRTSTSKPARARASRWCAAVTRQRRAEAEFMLGALLPLLRRVPVRSMRRQLLVGPRTRRQRRSGLVGMAPAARSLAAACCAASAPRGRLRPGGACHATPSGARWRVEPLGLRELLAAVATRVCVQLTYFTATRACSANVSCRSASPTRCWSASPTRACSTKRALAEALASGRMAAAWLDSVGAGLRSTPGRPLHGIDDAAGHAARGQHHARSRALRSAWAGGAAASTRLLEPSRAAAPRRRSRPTARRR